MGAERGLPVAIAGLLTALWLAGCGGSLNSSHQVSGSEQLSGVQQTVAQSGGAPTSLSASGGTQVAQLNGSAQAKPAPIGLAPQTCWTSPSSRCPISQRPCRFRRPEPSIFLWLVRCRAEGKTTQELERDLTAKLGATYLQNPQVTVLVKENNSQRVTIQGAVEKPGVYPVKGKTSLLELVAMAGGLKSSSDSTVLVLRQQDGKRSAAKFDVGTIQKGRADDPTMQAGDVVVAGTSAIKAGFNNVLKALPIAGLFAFL